MPPLELELAPKARPRSEWVMRAFVPLSLPLVRVFAALGVNPLAVVTAHGLLGFAAAALVAWGDAGAWLVAAVLLQVKTLLDNTDGALARATGRVTQAGRLYDTILDAAVNAALFAALAVHGSPWLALGAFALLTFLLTLDFNAERLHRAAVLAGSRASTGDEAGAPFGTGGADVPAGLPAPALAFLRGTYERLFAPQDRLAARLDARLMRAAGGEGTGPSESWNDVFSTASLVNLGLSSQMVLLGVFLVAGVPYGYVVSVFLQSAYVLAVQVVRIARYRGRARAGFGTPRGMA